MPTVICGKCQKPFSWPAHARVATCPNCGNRLTLRDVRFTTEKEGEFFQ